MICVYVIFFDEHSKYLPKAYSYSHSFRHSFESSVKSGNSKTRISRKSRKPRKIFSELSSSESSNIPYVVDDNSEKETSENHFPRFLSF